MSQGGIMAKPLPAIVFGMLFLSARVFAQLHLNWSSTISSTNHGSPGCPACGMTHASAVGRSEESDLYVAVATYDYEGTNGWDTILRKYAATGSVEWDHSFRSTNG